MRGALRKQSATVPVEPSFQVAGLSTDDAIDVAISRSSCDSLHSDYDVSAWLHSAYSRASLQTRRIPLRELVQWKINEETGNIEHEAGKFFTVLGATVRQRQQTDELVWNQPFVDQAEVGILGILATVFDGILHFCLQAKEEPGNINSIQLSPTVQATYSNYMRSHGGKAPALVGMFLEPRPDQVIFSRLQTEDGGRFLFKSNRNIILRCNPDELPALPDNFIWLTLRQIVALLKRDNVVNACARSILSSLLQASPVDGLDFRAAARKAGLNDAFEPVPFPSRINAETGEYPGISVRTLLGWRDEQKARTHLHVKRVPLASLPDWRIDRSGYFSHKKGRFFRVIGISVQSSEREVCSWSQPILENPSEGIIGLLVKNIAGRRHILMQAKAEPGNRPPVQLAPTVQFTPGNYLDNVSLQRPFLFEEFMSPKAGKIISETRQSEEGARFYRESHLHRIIEVPEDFELELPDNYRWFSIDAVRFFLHLGEHVNSCARSILACLL